ELLAVGDHDYFLYYYDDLLRNDLPATGSRLTLRSLPGEGSLHSRIERVACDNADRLDWLLLTCPLENFQGYLPPFARRRGPRLAAIIYDLIPLRFPDHYLAHPGIAAAYRRALAAVRNYDLLLTISQSARQDVYDLLQASPNRVVTIGAASDGEFFQPPTSRGDPQSIAWLTRHGIHKPFVYAVSAPDYRKNLSGLLAAWRRLPEPMRERYQCVITCATNSAESARPLHDMVTVSPDYKNVVFTEALDDDSLRRLYQQAAAFVFPSRYEGFGLPLLEAMQCGAAVIAGDNSSQVEVVGDAGLLANVDDPQQLSERITRLLDRPELADELRARGVRQARQFSWPQVASRCLAALTGSNAARRANWLRAWTARGRLAVANRFETDAHRMRGVRA
ncbi:MAG: glycosyltransferase family 4 protein, partial [Pirellulales bacterium]